jgi:hypothetical protein
VVQPNTLPPNTNGTIDKPVFPKVRRFISASFYFPFHRTGGQARFADSLFKINL